MKYEHIIFSTSGALSTIVLNRPDKLNAYTPDMGDEIIDAYRKSIADDNIIAIALLGSGKSFCAGADKEFLIGNKVSKLGLKIGEDEFISSFTQELSSTEKILIAGIHGSAVGIGVTMVLPFDIRFATNDALFSFPFTKLGILPGLGSSFFLPELIGSSKAKEIILSNATINAQDALQIGLINEIISDDNLALRIQNEVSKYEKIDKKVIFAAKKAFMNNLEEKVQNAIKAEKDLLKTIR
tara:strand:+ start:608 stop:1327 length:720 start_codon:yes stop_codon:yes gene_type:complete